jgi:hypothetical protein
MSNYSYPREATAFEQYWATSDEQEYVDQVCKATHIRLYANVICTVAKFCAKWAWIARAKRDSR